MSILSRYFALFFFAIRAKLLIYGLFQKGRVLAQDAHATSFSEVMRSVPFAPGLRARARRGNEWSALHEYGVWQEP